MLFTEGNDLAWAFRVLEEIENEHLPLYEFHVPLHVRVRSATAFTQIDFVEFLERAVTIYLDHRKDDTRMGNSVVQLLAVWPEIQAKR